MTPYDAAPGARVFGYMGTAGHAADLEAIAPAIASVLEANPDLSFETFGSIKAPKSLKQTFGGRVREISAAGSYLDFLAQFSKMKWRCGLAPILDTPFNACKANTKFIEYTVAGIPVVASDLPVYREIAAAGRGVLAGNAPQWADAVGALVSDTNRAAAQVSAAQTYVRDRYSMSRLRAQLLQEIGLSDLAEKED
jgi:glycosyltransferase involved in cell wall biosynthesis